MRRRDRGSGCRRVLALLVATGTLSFSTVAMAASIPTNRAEAELLVRQAAEAVERGDFELARENYRAVAEGGFGTADVLFNLGTAALQGGHLGEAVLAFERALRVDPGHEDARANLEAARARIVDELGGAAEGPPFLERLARALPPAPVTWGLAVFWLVFFAGLLIRRWRPSRWVTAVTALSLLGVLVFGAAFGLVVWYREAVDEAVVMQDALSVKKGPGPKFDTAFEIHEGLTVRVLEQEGPYVRIRLSNGLEGWVERKGLARIWPPDDWAYEAPA